MELIATEEFLAWANVHGIGWDPRYPRAQQLSFLATPGHWRTWETPATAALAWFTHLVLQTVRDDGDLVLYPRDGGRWYTGGDTTPWPNQALDQVVRGVGIPSDFTGAARFAASEIASPVTLAAASLVFGWGTGEDFYVVPDSANAILMTSHHREIYGAFRSRDERDRFTARLVEAGYIDRQAEPSVLDHDGAV